MTKIAKNSASLPTREQLLQFINNASSHIGKREIARAFNLDPEQKRELKKLLRAMVLEGELLRNRRQKFSDPKSLPEISILIITQIDNDGDLLALPAAWPKDIVPPRIYMAPERPGQTPLGIGDRVLAKIKRHNDQEYVAKTIRKIALAPTRVLGIYNRANKNGRLLPTNKRYRNELFIPFGEDLDAIHGELVRAEVLAGKLFGRRKAKVVERLGIQYTPKTLSAIAIQDYDIPEQFSAASILAAKSAQEAPFDNRTDLRHIPLVTIDGLDARDFDDAVWAEPDLSGDNDGGWHLLVAIADVAWYVRPGGELDSEARRRGNSVYFPDKVVPMLPEALSNGLCSLRPGQNRPCLAVHMWITQKGRLKRHEFVRGIMRSVARLTYEQVQSAWDGYPDDQTRKMLGTVITPLYGALEALLKYRETRGALELDLPERSIQLADNGSVTSILERERLDSHRLIEEFMITANVAAAETLERLRQPCIFRVHDRPSEEKLEILSQYLKSIELPFSKKQIQNPKRFNQLLTGFAGSPQSRMIGQIILRSQAQAEYSQVNIGHFGLALKKYSHFTSPIRRYADLIVHRSLIQGLKLGLGGLPSHIADLNSISEYISKTERRAAKAERDTNDRITSLLLTESLGAEFSARINGLSKAGLFVTLKDPAADGLVPIRTLPNDYYEYDSILQTLTGRKNALVYRLGQQIRVRLDEANPLTGGLILSLSEVGKKIKNVPRSRGKRSKSKLKNKKKISLSKKNDPPFRLLD